MRGRELMLVCDTMVALGRATKDGSVIFAKNSDRQPNEPHLLMRIPRKKHPKGAQLKCTYITIDQVEETYEVLLLKPSWIWGAEMGANEFGLNIGNEAVFTRVRQGLPSLLGMDLLRLALERCRTSLEAVHLITELLAKHGQGGNCGYEKEFVYHNSFLIADRETAWVLETAGPFWAAKQVKDVYAISNRLSIGSDFDLAHPDLVDYAISRKWCTSRADFHFASCYSNRLFTYFSGAENREQACTLRLQQDKGSITVETMLAILRSHEPALEKASPFRRPSVRSVCMHAGGLVGDHTTGSYVAHLTDKLDTYWITGSSTPCLSIFKPYWMTENSILFGDGQEEEAQQFWLLREELHRLVLQGRVPDLEDYLHQAAELERELLDLTRAVSSAEPTAEQLAVIMKQAWAREQELVQSTVERSRPNLGRIQGRPYFRRYWEKQSKKLGL